MVESETNQKVILLVGLDNSGKTSIANSLRGMKNLPIFCKTKPTVGRNIVSIDSYDTKFILWDLGGQEAYRGEYLENFNKYFKGIDKLIYVYDVQDIERYSIALDYCEKILNLVKEKIKPNELDISIFLHKYDPDLNETKPVITKKIIDDLKEKIKKILDNTEFFYQIFQTTVYAIFEKRVTD